MTCQRNRAALWMILCAATIFYSVYIVRSGFVVLEERYFCLFDDAMISMRYAENLANGHGLRWNVGEEPVEGFTNLLWTLWMAAVHALPLAKSKMSLAVKISGAVLLLANIAVVWLLCRRLSNQSAFAPVVAASLVAFHYGGIFWTLCGMEVGLLALLVNAQALVLLREHERYKLFALSVLTMLSIATRPDAIVSEIVIWFFAAVMASRGRRMITAAAGIAAIAVAVAGVTTFRIGYYGDALPNTYYLKMTGATLFERAERGAGFALQSFLLHLWPFLALGFWCLWRNRHRLAGEAGLLMLMAIGLAQIAYSIYVGADAWESFLFPNRYIEIGYAALVVAGIVSLERLLQRATENGPVPGGIPRGMLLLLAGLLGTRSVSLFLSGISAAEKLDNNEIHGRAGIIVAFTAASLLLAVALFVKKRHQETMIIHLRRWCTRGDDGITHCRAGFVFCLFLLFWLPLESSYFIKWAHDNIEQYAEAEDFSRLGLLIRASADRDASMAVAWAGALPYFAECRAIDVLGKNDPVIARSPRRMEKFVPGHDRWDYSYSIDQLRPDIIAMLAHTSPEDHRHFRAIGYELLPNSLLVDRSSKKLNARLIRVDWAETASLEYVLLHGND